ncbi:hypothetical protein [Erwinia sp. JH02]|uniref:hypothetical protein n=1 Tax=Erwinia sp. JH02 TaxID=2733394 RepID=UPI001489097C|nr:hypothetical protein [Erwinia sp. JH02]NNS05780.1 hypothetical protein [Erwinia sp. JH02]
MAIKTLSVVLLLSISYYSNAVDSYIDTPTQKASELVKEYAITDDEADKKSALEGLRLLSEQNPKNVNVIRIYSSVLSSKGEYSQAATLLHVFNQQNNYPSLILNECMLKDRMGNYDSACYSHFISLKRSLKVYDSDYLMALFLTEDGSFEKEKEAYIKNTPNKEDLDAFNNGKSALLEKLYPNVK